MTKVVKIARLKHPGVFRDFSWPADLPTFGRYNLIYGWNGSGKTTVSNLFRDLEHRRVPEHAEAVCDIEGGMISQDRFEHASVDVRVFNRNFIQENIFPSGGGDVPPIFIVGKENIEKQKEVERLKIALDTARGQVSANGQKRDQAQRTLDQH